VNDYEEMFYGTLPQDTQDFSQVLSGVGRSLKEIGRSTQYLPYDILGAPVDLATMAMRPFGYQNQTPVGGSDWLIQLARQYGVADQPTGSGIETATRLATSIPSPVAAARGMNKIDELVNLITKPQKEVPYAKDFTTKETNGILEVTPTTTPAISKRVFGTGSDEGVYPGTVASTRGLGQTIYGVGEQEANRQIRSFLNQPESNRAFQIANQYTAQNLNQNYNIGFTLPESSLAKQSGIGRTYEIAAEYSDKYPKDRIFQGYLADPEYGPMIQQMGIKSYDDLLERSYKQLEKETMQQFKSLPVKMSFHNGELNYLDSNEMLRDIVGHNHLTVYRGGDRHDFLNKIDNQTGLNSNEQFRAVHDYFGHGIKGNPFGAKGEEVAWASHQQMFSPLARIAMTAETRGQNSFVNYTPINAELVAQMEDLRRIQREAERIGDTDTSKRISDRLREKGSEWGYAKQASIVLPAEFTKIDFRGGMPDYLMGIVEPKFGSQETLTHFGKSPDIGLLDPTRYKTGIKGAEARRLMETEQPIVPRSYAYRGDVSQVTPEPGLGPYVYQTQAGGLYDIESDPERLGLLSKVRNTGSYLTPYGGILNEAQELTDLERLAAQYGYRGLLNPGGAILFQPTPVTRIR